MISLIQDDFCSVWIRGLWVYISLIVLTVHPLPRSPGIAHSRCVGMIPVIAKIWAVEGLLIHYILSSMPPLRIPARWTMTCCYWWFMYMYILYFHIYYCLCFRSYGLRSFFHIMHNHPCNLLKKVFYSLTVNRAAPTTIDKPLPATLCLRLSLPANSQLRLFLY